MICTSSQPVSRHEPLALLERLLGRLHARLHADEVADLPLQQLVQPHQQQHRVLARR